MSAARTVPSVVPSDIHNSLPDVPSLALKYTWRPTATMSTGLLGPAPGLMSLTGTVPARVPSDFHSSRPRIPSSALKSSRLPRLTAAPGTTESMPLPAPGLMSPRGMVPPGVPSDLHSSRPAVPSLAENISVPAALTSPAGSLFPATGLMSVSRKVPSGVPSDLHSSSALSGRLRREVQDPADLGERAEGAGARTARVLDHERAGLRAVRPPQRPPVRAVVGREEQHAPEVGERPRTAALRARADVLDAGGPRGGPVGPPQLFSGRRVVGTEEERVADRCHVAGVAALRLILRGSPGRDVLDQDGPGGGAVGLEQLAAYGAVGRPRRTAHRRPRPSQARSSHPRCRPRWRCARS